MKNTTLESAAKPSLASILSGKRTLVILGVLVIAGLGVWALRSSGAASFVLSAEAESGTTAGQASVQAVSGASGQAVKFGQGGGGGGTATFPLKVGPSKRYLVGANNTPFFFQADTAWNLPGELSDSEAIQYFDARKSQGFNTILVSLVNLNRSTVDNAKSPSGEPVFSGGDMGNPNPAYFAHLDKLIGMARDRGMQLAIWPAWSQFAVRESSFTTANMQTYGRFLGERYRNTPNIMWTMGGDWGNGPEGDCPASAQVRALGNAIKAADPNHMMSYHSGYNQSSSDCHHNESWLDYNGSYWDFNFSNMASAYRLVYRDYNKTPTKPAVMLETAYEGPSPNDDIKLYSIHARKMSVYQVLAGGMGFTYGANSTFRMNNANTGANARTWQATLTIPGGRYQGYIGDLFKKRLTNWAAMVPDEGRATLIGGNGSSGSNDYALAGRASNGSLVVAYTPSARTLKIDMSKLSGSVTARWYDPTAGTYRSISGSPFANSGSRDFATPGNNAANEGDWLLVLETNPVQ